MKHTHPAPEEIQTAEERILRSYWRGNIRLMSLLLLVWAMAGLGCGVVFADFLNQYNLPGTAYPLGFWFAQQGSIIIFVLLILIYAVRMNQLDRAHHRERERIPGARSEEAPFTSEGI